MTWGNSSAVAAPSGKVSATTDVNSNISLTTSPLKFTHLSTTDGLSHSEIFDVTEDAQGFMWIATADGLSRYDGEKFTYYRHNANNDGSIADNFIRKVFIDDQNNLWVGTQNGLSRYNDEVDSFENYTNDLNNENSLADNVIWDIYQDNNKIIWVSTATGLHKFSKNNNYFSRVRIRGHDNILKEIKTIFQDRNNNYWLGTFEHGIYLLNKNLSYAGSLQDNNRFDLIINAKTLFDIKFIDNHYWLATDKGTYVINDRYEVTSKIDTTTTPLILSNEIRAIEVLNDNHVWLATKVGLVDVNLLDDSITTFQHANHKNALSENWLMNIYKDKTGVMWIGTYGGGINKYSPLSSKFSHKLFNYNNKNYRVESFVETSDKTIWFSTERNGLFKIKNNAIEKIILNLKDTIWQLFSDKKNNLWLRTKNSKLYQYNITNNELIERKNWASSSQFKANKLAIMLNDNLWYINQSGVLTSYHITTSEFKYYPSKNNVLFLTIQKDQDNNLLLISNTNEIFTFKINNHIFLKSKLKLPNDFNNHQKVIIAISQNWMWFGSESQGLTLINKNNNKITIFNEKNHLRNNFIASIIVDRDENAWIATNKGISVITPITKKVIHYDNDFTINSPEFIMYSSLHSSRGQILFGSPNGFYSFDPKEVLQVTQSIPQPLFTNLYIANKKIIIRPKAQYATKKNSINLNDKSHINNIAYSLPMQLNSLEQLNLQYKQSPIRFEFISPNAKLPAQLRYKYKLANLESDWIDADINNHSATYTNLSSGDYVFEVLAFDLHNPKNTKTSRLNVHIMPPWWLSQSAILVYALLSFLFIAFVIQQLRIRRLNHLQIKLSEERLKLSLWGSGDEMWDWNIKTGKIFRSNIWGILEFPQDGTRNVGTDKTNVHQHDLPRVRQALEDHFSDKTEHFEATYRVQDKNDHWIWILDRGKIVERDDKKTPLRMTGTLKDISQIKKAEERLKLFAKCIENISDAVIIYDRQFIAVDVNKAFRRITGKTKEHMIGQSLTFNQYPQSFCQNVKKHLITEGSWHGEIESKRENGSAYLTDLSIDIIRDENNNVSHFVAVFSDITKRKETEAELRKLASSDTLTGLPNRSFFQANQSRLVKNKTPHALLVFDLDNFKKINDSLGHQVGDALLCKVAERMISIGRSQDTIYRLGGDEFSIIIEDTNDIHTITTLAKEILLSIAQPFKLKSQEIVLYSSIGIVLYPEDGISSHELLKNADTAMYHAKDLGGNKYQFFSDSMNKQAVKRLQVENMIRHGLKEDLFSVFYQPKIEISTGKIAGMEALVRFETPNKGIISPVVFIPVSEETGQIIDIGEIVLRKACFATKKWVDSGLFDGRVAVNLSAVQFTQANLVGLIASILKESKLPAKHLELEITEGTVMDSPQQAIETMLQIRALGIHLSLDDFGTGYSSLAYLKKFPLNTLKIDKAFVDDIEHSEQGRNMVATIVTIAHNLDMQVVAEGVETNQQLSFLSGLRCEQLQGYLYSKPLATDQFQKYLLAHQITDKSTAFNNR